MSRKAFAEGVSLRIAIIEVIVFVLLFSLGGYVFHRHDFLFLQAPFPPVFLLVLVFSLYRGMFTGFFALLLLFLLAQIFYSEAFIDKFLWCFVLTVIGGEFHYHWRRKMNEAEAKALYCRERLDSLQKHFAFLKLSHDQLENNYVLRPYSLRRALEELKQRLMSEKDEKAMAKFLILILNRNFAVSRAAIYKGSLERGFTMLACTSEEDAEELDLGDPMVRAALHLKEMHYVSWGVLEKFPDRVPRYLAIIPWEFQQGTTYLLAIRDMAFVNLNDEVMHYLHLLLSFVVEEVCEVEGQSLIAEDFTAFLRETRRALRFYKEFGVESTIVFLNVAEESYPIGDVLQGKLRTLDALCNLGNGRVAILLPLTNASGAKAFLLRLQQEIPSVKVERVVPVREDFLALLEELRTISAR